MKLSLVFGLSALLALGACAPEDPATALLRSNATMDGYRAGADRLALVVRADRPVAADVVAACITPHVTALRDTALHEEASRVASKRDPELSPRFQDVMRSAEGEVEGKIWECGRARGYRHFELAAGSLRGFYDDAPRMSAREFVRRVARDRAENQQLNVGTPSAATTEASRWASLFTIRGVMSPSSRLILPPPQ